MMFQIKPLGNTTLRSSEKFQGVTSTFFTFFNNMGDDSFDPHWFWACLKNRCGHWDEYIAKQLIIGLSLLGIFTEN